MAAYQKLFLVTLVAVLIVGCSSSVALRSYAVPSGATTVDLELLALDKYRNNDTIELSVVSRFSCASRLVMAQVTSIGSQGVSDKDAIRRTSVKLPANEILNLNIYNESGSGAKKTSCSETQSVLFEANKRYAMKVNNWSTSGLSSSGFGCKFRVVEIDSNGKEIRTLPLNQPRLPICVIQ